jgi:RNA polymerase-binding transcription factor DksA
MDESATREILDGERRATLARMQDMARDFEGIVTAATDANGDDEHDPEGSTVAFERAQVAALLAQARAHLDDLDRALTRLDTGLYSVCERCGDQIAAPRLLARPAARTCIDCAEGSPSSVPGRS